MNRPVLVLLAIGLVAALAWWALAGTMPGYFAAWLFWIGVPMGALPLVMALEGAGALGSPLLPALRAMLPLLPLGTLFGLPLLGGLSGLFARTGLPGALPAWWTAPVTLGLRDGACLVVLSLFALLFWITPRRPRRVVAVLGLLVSLSLGTLLGFDWMLAPQPALGSSLVGLLLMSGQMVLAGAIAGLMVAVGTEAHARLPQGCGLLLGLLVAFWLFLQFAQFLVVWSADLPDEAAWYLVRLNGGGAAVMAYTAIAACAAIALLPSLIGRVPAAVATISVMLVIALLAVTLLLVLPAFRGRLSLDFSDAVAFLGLGDLLVGAMVVLRPTRRRTVTP